MQDFKRYFDLVLHFHKVRALTWDIFKKGKVQIEEAGVKTSWVLVASMGQVPKNKFPIMHLRTGEQRGEKGELTKWHGNKNKWMKWRNILPVQVLHGSEEPLLPVSWWAELLVVSPVDKTNINYCGSQSSLCLCLSLPRYSPLPQSSLNCCQKVFSPKKQTKIYRNWTDSKKVRKRQK